VLIGPPGFTVGVPGGDAIRLGFTLGGEDATTGLGEAPLAAPAAPTGAEFVPLAHAVSVEVSPIAAANATPAALPRRRLPIIGHHPFPALLARLW
jgi:hypothetical protein